MFSSVSFVCSPEIKTRTDDGMGFLRQFFDFSQNYTARSINM
jgi:hypothetical protein